MKPNLAILILLMSFGGLVACSQDSDVSVKEEPLVEQEAIGEQPNLEQNDQALDDNCGSLKPLLKLLPRADEIDGLPEVFRGCENSSEQFVSVIYANEGDNYTEYEFKISVLNPESIYAKANLQLENATAEQQAFLDKTFKFTGDMHKTQFNTCAHYHQNPLIPDGRNPLITTIHGLDVCVMDNLDANKEIWNLYGIKNDLEFRLELKGYKAGQIGTTEAAQGYLIGTFNQFDLN